jgi:hypothetical protein
MHSTAGGSQGSGSSTSLFLLGGGDGLGGVRPCLYPGLPLPVLCMLFLANLFSMLAVATRDRDRRC